MSTFNVVATKIAKVWSHPNADKLDLAQIEGSAYQFVVGKGQYKVGDTVIYFPIDSLLPAWIVEKAGLTGKLAGSEKNRIKTIKLRQEISQGLVLSPSIFDGTEVANKWATVTPDQLTELLGVKKYEPPAIICHAGTLRPMPDGVGVYDIEGADSNPNIVDMLMNRQVCITEKIEGTNFWTSCLNEDVSVGQRQFSIEPTVSEMHTFWQAAMDEQLIDLCKRLANSVFSGKRVTLRGELCGPGIQKNIYGLKALQVFLFDILVDGKYLDVDDFYKYTDGFKVAPVLAKNVLLKDWLNGKSLRAASDGLSVFSKTAREGIVIKPISEQFEVGFGRLCIKQRSPEYLAKTDF